MNSPKSKLLNFSEPDKEGDFPEVSSILNIEIKHKYNRLYLKCKKSKKNTQPGEKPVPVKTHLRDAIVMPEMVGNFVAVYNGKSYNNV